MFLPAGRAGRFLHNIIHCNAYEGGNICFGADDGDGDHPRHLGVEPNTGPHHELIVTAGSLLD